MEEIFKISSCIEILGNDIKIYTIEVYVIQLTKNYKVCIFRDLHPTCIRGISAFSGRAMYELF